MNITISEMGYPMHFYETESDFVGMWMRIMRKEYWSQSKIFLVSC